MTDTPNNSELTRQIQRLHDEMNEGFKVTHKKQDETNGKVKENTEFRQRTQGIIDALKWTLGFMGMSNVVLIIKILFF